jgi:hypothetical protein
MFEKHDHPNPVSFQGPAAHGQAADLGSAGKNAGEHGTPSI